MTPFTVYEKSSGRILMVGSGSRQAASSYVTDTAGVVLASGSVHGHYVRDGAVVELPPRPSAAHAFDYGSRAWTTTPQQLKEHIREQRRNAYPAMGEQLDAIWHAMDQGVLPRIEPMYSQIKAVKADNPL